MKLKKFKEEFRMMSTDTWADALDAWFEIAGQLHLRGAFLPNEWDYKPASKVGGRDYKSTILNEDSYFHEIFDNAETNDLIDIGKFLFRYSQYLRYNGIDY